MNEHATLFNQIYLTVKQKSEFTYREDAKKRTIYSIHNTTGTSILIVGAVCYDESQVLEIVTQSGVYVYDRGSVTVELGSFEDFESLLTELQDKNYTFDPTEFLKILENNKPSRTDLLFD